MYSSIPVVNLNSCSVVVAIPVKLYLILASYPVRSLAVSFKD